MVNRITYSTCIESLPTVNKEARYKDEELMVITPIKKIKTDHFENMIHEQDRVRINGNSKLHVIISIGTNEPSDQLHMYVVDPNTIPGTFQIEDFVLTDCLIL